jgi:hypothetical protein
MIKKDNVEFGTWNLEARACCSAALINNKQENVDKIQADNVIKQRRE